MSSSTSSSNSVVNVESSEVTHTTSSSARDVRSSDHPFGQRSEGPSYEWIDSCVLNIPTSFRDFNSLDKILFEFAFIKPKCPPNVMMVDICGYTDQVCHGRETHPKISLFVYNTFFSNLHITLPYDDFTMGVLQIINVA